MPKFEVAIGPAKYEVEAPDETTAWQWANVTHNDFGKADEPGKAQTALIGAGRATDQIKQGIKQLYMKATGNTQGLADQAIEQKANDAAYAPLKEAHPFLTGMGETAPYLAIPASASIPAVMASAAAIGGAKYGTGDERLKTAIGDAASAGIGAGVGKVVGSLIAPVSKNTEARTAALQAAKELGYRPRLSEITGSRYAGMLEDMAARTPGGAGVMADFAARNQGKINEAAAGSIGETASELTPAVFAAAQKRLGQVFNDIRNLPGKVIGISPSVGSAADEVLRIQGKMIPGEQDAALTALANQAKALAANKGKIDGEAYQLIRSGLSSASYDATGTNKTLYGKLLEALDNSAEQSLKSIGKDDLAAALRTVRPQYANLKMLEKGAVAEGGQVSAPRLAAALRNNNPAAFREGRIASNPLYDIAQVGESLKPLQRGSQTYERGNVSDILSTLLKAPVAYGAAKATTSPLTTAYPRMLATHPMLNQGAEYAAMLANPTARSLAALLAKPALAPVVGE